MIDLIERKQWYLSAINFHNNKVYYRLFHDVVTWDVDHEAIKSTDCTVSFISQRSAVIGAFRSSYCSIVPTSSCSLSGPLLHCSPVVVFFDRGHPCFRNFNSTIPVDVIRVKSYVNSFLDVTLRVYQWGSRSIKPIKQRYKKWRTTQAWLTARHLHQFKSRTSWISY